MIAYLVDYVSFSDNSWYSGDSRDKIPYSRDESQEPSPVRLTKHCNMRAGEGWRLVKVLSGTQLVEEMGAWLFFER